MLFGVLGPVLVHDGDALVDIAPLADLTSECLHSGSAPHLEQLHLQALEWRNDARLSLARHASCSLSCRRRQRGVR
jgi:hypothetical protein